jgi:hypothetical protein
MKKAYDDMNEYITKRLSKEKDSKIAEKHKTELKDIFENQSPELVEINTKFLPLDFTGPFTADKQQAMEDARELIDGFKKYFTSITKLFKTSRSF